MAKVFSISLPEELYQQLLEITKEDTIQKAVRKALSEYITMKNDHNYEYIIELLKRIVYKIDSIGNLSNSILQAISQINISGTRYHKKYTQQQDDTNYKEMLERAKLYRNKILEKEGKITSEQLEKVAKKFKVKFDDLIEDLLMKESGIYVPIDQQ